MQNDQKNLKGFSFAYRISSELIAAVIVGVLLGLFLDKLLDTKPIFLISLIILGFLAGLLNIYRLISPIENNQ